jgi:predicted anti-sigma-YlaC factor YlaD
VSGGGGCGEIRPALGVYLLGAIAPADRSAVASHLARCAECREVLARLAGLPGLLGTVPADDAARLAMEDAGGAAEDELPQGVTLRSLLAQVARRRRRRLWRWLAVTAAVVVIAAGGAVAVSRVLLPPGHHVSCGSPVPSPWPPASPGAGANRPEPASQALPPRRRGIYGLDNAVFVRDAT